ncbi:Molybdopterin molybdenumtransferase [hydrothermal vent metagenome]|uniref:molybdopterin molybdotransferase n=1 Tax=hydrothermal vent metagenome TaxID=652676 RepID=A0A3B0W3M7_9ZZZZ
MKTFDEALAYLLSKVVPITKVEEISIHTALGRVLSQDITSQFNVPANDNSMMDGYAVRAEEIRAEKVFHISQRIAAGSVGEPLEKGSVARIFTGATMPQGADSVIMQEEAVTEGEGGVKFLVSSVRPTQNVRHTGEDITQGTVILAKGHKLRAQDLGLIASIGMAKVEVYQPLTIATFTTGDELLEPGERAEAGKIYNANRYILAGLIPQLGFELIDLGRVPDTLEATIEALKQAASVADVVITTGGVSVGDEDHIKPAVEHVGQLDLWKVKMKPGKPLAYGHVMDKPFIGLPGNPVSAFSTFNLFARPFLLSMQGQKHVLPQPIWLKAKFDWTKKGFRQEFVRARLKNQGKDTVVTIFPNQGSGVLTSTVWADGLAVIPENSTIKKDDLVAYYPFEMI